MILVDNKIKDRVNNFSKYQKVYCKEAKPLIENFKLKNLQSASYDITITNKIRVFNNDYRKIKLSNEDDVKNASVEKDILSGYDLKPNEYILVQVNESINMPNDLTAHIRPRTTFTRIGLILTAQHFNPSYCGNVQLGLYNATNSIIEITTGLKVGQIVFETLDGEPDVDNLYCNKETSKYQNEHEFVESKIYDELDLEDKKLVDESIDKILKGIR